MHRGSPPPRAGSPLQREFSPIDKYQNGTMGSGSYSTNALSSTIQQQGLPQENALRFTNLTPRSGGSGRHSPGQSPLTSTVPAPINQAQAEADDRGRGRAWAFRSESPSKVPVRDGVSPDPDYGRGRAASPFGNVGQVMRPGSSSWQVPQHGYAPSRQSPHSRLAQSPGRGSGAITFPRSLSPGLLETSSPGSSAAVRGHSPGASVRALSPGNSLAGSIQQAPGGGGFNWQSAPPLSPRVPGPGTSVSRIASPGMQPQVGGVNRISSPGGMVRAAPQPQGFTWSPEPSSPRTSPRSYSPAPVAMGGMKAQSSVPRWPM